MTDQAWHEARTPGRPDLPTRVKLALLPFVLPFAGPVYALRQDKRAQYHPTPDHLVTFAPGPGGRPGFRVRSFSRPLMPARDMPDGRHSYGDLQLTERRDRMILICWGHVSTVGSPQAALARAMAGYQDHAVQFTPAVVTDFGFGPVHAAWVRLRSGMGLTELRFERHGWVFGAGVCAFSGVPHVQAHTDAVLRSWTWLDAVSPAGPR